MTSFANTDHNPPPVSTGTFKSLPIVFLFHTIFRLKLASTVKFPLTST